MTLKNQTDFHTLAQEARIKVLSMIHQAGTSHIGSNFSCIDFATVLYEQASKQDQIVWSKGWAAATIYYFLAKQGKIPKEDLDKFPQAPYLGLAEPYVPGVFAAGGAAGHGLPIAVGMALAKKLKGEKGKVYCIMSDGELNCGTTWESAALAKHHKLDNLVILVDVNGWQALGKTEDVLNIDAQQAFLGFGCDVKSVDGHNFLAIAQSLERVAIDRPMVVLFQTIKGNGVSFMEDKLEYHYLKVTDEMYEKALKEFDA